MTPRPDDGTPFDGPPLRPSFAVRVTRTGGRWLCELLAADAEEELPVLERALGRPAPGRPDPFVVVVDSRLYFVVLRHGPGGMVRVLISDATSQEWLLAAEAVERYGIPVEAVATIDSYGDGRGRPGGDLDVFSDAGLPAEELSRLLESEELWADEMVLAIAERLGFAAELVAVAAA